jgi:hypothetical protein
MYTGAHQRSHSLQPQQAALGVDNTPSNNSAGQVYCQKKKKKNSGCRCFTAMPTEGYP